MRFVLTKEAYTALDEIYTLAREKLLRKRGAQQKEDSRMLKEMFSVKHLHRRISRHKEIPQDYAWEMLQDLVVVGRWIKFDVKKIGRAHV